ncbi:MAG: hypothetical protein PHD36_06630 [Desulfotomaculaceae bacterium]|nr:hypothetical protein [Desulfotomaculaceae bacterium]
MVARGEIHHVDKKILKQEALTSVTNRGEYRIVGESCRFYFL